MKDKLTSCSPYNFKYLEEKMMTPDSSKKRDEYLESKISKLFDLLSEFAKNEDISFDDLSLIFFYAANGLMYEKENGVINEK